MTTALYRRYRPETFADVIGQEHVTEPLMQALRTGRVNHAYLFSGPRGCGKTTSARILARCLNCVQGPTPRPCGVCDSCVALARGGAGSVDVIEIDAASHGGVDDARDLRERASFGPASSRYKIYIIDEAHMVTPQGFNALLKIVEEPPEHVKFVFATTEPEKVIGTIRSRTHHYPFRLVPPKKLSDYMETLLDAEGVAYEPGVLSFVTRAGGGSVRDSLSVLDQLIAGSGPEGLTYAGAASLLGFTDDELLDGIIEAFAAGDSAAVFRQIDRVVESGADPRRFVEDLLERLRDLIVVAAVAEGAGAVLRSVPEDQLERMRSQAASFGAGALSRAADVINAGLTEMTGATSPRLQLELMCARVLLPGIAGLDGYAARLDRMERRLDMGELPPRAAAGPMPHAPAMPPAGASAPTQGGVGASAGAASGVGANADRAGRSGGSAEDAASATAGVAGAAGAPQPATAPRWQSPSAGAAQESSSTGDNLSRAPGAGAGGGRAGTAGVEGGDGRAGQSGASRPAGHGEAAPEQGQRAAAAARDDARVEQPQSVTGGVSEAERERAQRDFDATQQSGGASSPQQGSGERESGQPARGGMSTDDIRRAWPDVLDRIFRIKRVTWTLLSQNAQVAEFDGRRLILGATSEGLAGTMSRGQHMEVVRQALIEAIGVDVAVEARAMTAGAAAPSGQGGGHQGAANAAQPRQTWSSPNASPAGEVPNAQQSARGWSSPNAAPSGAQGSSRPQGDGGQSGASDGGSWGDEPAPHDAPPDDRSQFDEMAQFSASIDPSSSAGGAADGRVNVPAGSHRGEGVDARRQGSPGHDVGSRGATQDASGQNAWGDHASGGARSAAPQQGRQGQGRPGGWRDRTGWNGAQGGPARVDPARSGDPAEGVAPREADSPRQDAGLAAAAAQSSAWGSDSRGDWGAQAGPAPSWANDDASPSMRGAGHGSADESSRNQGSANGASNRGDASGGVARVGANPSGRSAEASPADNGGPSSGVGASGVDDSAGAPSSAGEPIPDWMEDEPETDVEAVYDPLPPRSGESDRAGARERAGDGQAEAAHDSAAAGSVAPAPQPTQGAVDDGRALTPRQRAEKAAREAAQRQEDAERGGRGRFDDASASVDDEDIENSDAVGLPIIKSVLGGTVIKEEGPDAN